MPYRDPEKRRAASREATRRWYQRNRERVRAAKRVKDRERYAARRENVLSAKRERFANDPVFAERLRAENRSWYARNRERRRESNRRYREINGEALRARERVRNRRKYERDPRAVLDYYKRWRERNLAKARAYVRAASIKRRAASQGQHFSAAEWLALVERHAGRCAYCGVVPDRLEADHRTPLCPGGSNLIDNILPACLSCNRRKHRKTEDEFRALLKNERGEPTP
jgi:5-methylcytosine-specific restriction endonuclease McrA